MREMGANRRSHGLAATAFTHQVRQRLQQKRSRRRPIDTVRPAPPWRNPGGGLCGVGHPGFVPLGIPSSVP
jgi:hypothetical protein